MKTTNLLGTLKESMNEKTVRICGIIVQARKITTKKNQPMAFVQLEDLTGTVEVVVFPGVLEKDATIWESKSPIVVDGRVSLKDGAIKILASATYDIDAQLPQLVESQNGNGYRNGNGGNGGGGNWGNGGAGFTYKDNGGAPAKPREPRKMTITIPKTAKKDLLMTLKEILSKYPGPMCVELMIPNTDSYRVVKTKAMVEANEELYEEIRKSVGEKSLAVG